MAKRPYEGLMLAEKEARKVILAMTSRGRINLTLITSIDKEEAGGEISVTILSIRYNKPSRRLPQPQSLTITFTTSGEPINPDLRHGTYSLIFQDLLCIDLPDEFFNDAVVELTEPDPNETVRRRGR